MRNVLQERHLLWGWFTDPGGGSTRITVGRDRLAIVIISAGGDRIERDDGGEGGDGSGGEEGCVGDDGRGPW